MLAEPFAAYDSTDPRIADTTDVLDELGTYAKAAQEKMEQRKAKGLPTDDAWFWTPFLILPKASINANTYLLQDDVPSILRFFGNHYATVTGSDGRLWEHSHLGQFTKCETTDNGTAGWFVENFRNMLVMEEGKSLWIARGAPRAWLGQGKRIAVGNAPSYFGAVAYEIVSDADNGRITAAVRCSTLLPAEHWSRTSRQSRQGAAWTTIPTSSERRGSTTSGSSRNRGSTASWARRASEVNSFHHQAVRDLGAGLVGTAWAPDGVIEGIEAPSRRFVRGVQWHRESVWREKEGFGDLFRGLVAEAAR